MYDFTDDQLNYLGAGIHKGVKLLKISKEPSKKDGTGQTVLRFTFEKEVVVGEGVDKYYFIYTAFPINAEKIAEMNENKPNSKWTNEQAIGNEMKWFSNKIKHILGAFIPKDKLIFKITEKDPEKAWDAFCDKVIELSGKAFEGISFDIKLIYDSKDRAIFPRYAFNPFIKNSTNSLVKLMIDPKFERVEPLPPTEETNEEWGATEAKPEDTTDDLPF
jgi:hypothetical protein